jgi:inosose dehydratase
VKARLGISPIAWWNDDLPELSDDISLEECLRQVHAAGFTGMETGRRFPMDAAVLSPILARHGIAVCGGWFSGLILDGDMEAEKDRIAAQMDFFKAAGAPCIVYGETARSIQGDRTQPLARKPRLTEDEMRAYGRRPWSRPRPRSTSSWPIPVPASRFSTTPATSPSPAATCCGSSTTITPASATSTPRTCA